MRALFVALVLLGPNAARADGPPARLQLLPAYAPVPLRTWTTFEVEACADRAVEATLWVESSSHRRRWDAGRVELHPRGCEQRHVRVLLEEDRLEAVLRDDDGEPLAKAHWDGGTTSTAAVLVLDPQAMPHVRAEAVDVSVLEPRAAEVLPDPLTWRAIGAVFLSEHALESANPGRRAAIEQWVELGGILVEVQPGSDIGQPGSGDVQVPARPVGLGRIESLALADPQRGVRISAILQDVAHRWNRPSRIGILEGAVLFRTLDAPLLDVSGHRVPSVWTIGGVLLAVVLLLAGLQTSPVRRRLGSLSPLVGAPVLGAVALVGIVGLAFAEKGTERVYESVAIVEAGSGARIGHMQRVAGLLATEAGRMVVRAQPGSLLTPIEDPSAVTLVQATTRGDGSTPMRVEMPAALWQTVHVREDAIFELGNGILLRRGHDVPDIRVENHAPFALHDVVVVAGSEDDRVALGDLLPGESRTIPWVRPVSRAPYPSGWPWGTPGGGAPPGVPILVARLDGGVVPGLPRARVVNESTLIRVVGAP